MIVIVIVLEVLTTATGDPARSFVDTYKSERASSDAKPTARNIPLLLHNRYKLHTLIFVS